MVWYVCMYVYIYVCMHVCMHVCGLFFLFCQAFQCEDESRCSGGGAQADSNAAAAHECSEL